MSWGWGRSIIAFPASPAMSRTGAAPRPAMKAASRAPWCCGFRSPALIEALHGGPPPHPVYGAQLNPEGVPGVPGEGRAVIRLRVFREQARRRNRGRDASPAHRVGRPGLRAVGAGDADLAAQRAAGVRARLAGSGPGIGNPRAGGEKRRQGQLRFRHRIRRDKARALRPQGQPAQPEAADRQRLRRGHRHKLQPVSRRKLHASRGRLPRCGERRAAGGTDGSATRRDAGLYPRAGPAGAARRWTMRA